MALLVPLKFLASQQRYELLLGAETEQVLVLSKRPSIPPGRLLVEKGEAVRRGGSVDFFWLLFRKGRSGSEPTNIDWLKGKKVIFSLSVRSSQRVMAEGRRSVSLSLGAMAVGLSYPLATLRTGLTGKAGAKEKGDP